jgi:CO/xanthine dehydrogenase Mo-binding subunit
VESPIGGISPSVTNLFPMAEKWVGTPVPRKEGWEKVTGRARYVDDIVLPDMIHGVTVRSTIARGTIDTISFEGDIPWDEFTIVTADDIPGENSTKMFVGDQPVLAKERVNHPEEPIVLLAHPDKDLVRKARDFVKIGYTEETPCLTIQDSLDRAPVVWGEDNIFKTIRISKGDIARGEEEAHTVVEGEYSTGASEQLYIENNGMIGEYDPKTGVTVTGSMQCPYYVHPALCSVFALPKDQVRVIQADTGGGFGGKEDYPTIIAAHACLLAMKAGRPVKLIYDREEDMVATTKRHPSRTRIRSGHRKDGTLAFIEVDFVLDGGAYMTLSPVVLSRGSIHAAGPYLCHNIRILGRAVATNYSPHGAYRGFGNPQSLFALERHMEQAAQQCGIDSVEFRRRNFLREADLTATRQLVQDRVDLNELMDRALEAADFYRKRDRFAQENEGRPVKRGIGLAAFFHGSGFTGGGEKKMASIAGVEGTAEGKVSVLAASTEIGQGTMTIFSQIVADALNLPYEMVEVARPDTHDVPNSGPTVASRTCMVVGKLVQTAALALKQSLVQEMGLEEDYTAEQFAEAVRKYVSAHGKLRRYAQYEQPANIEWSDETYVGDAYGAYGWAIYVAEVSFDTRTYEARVDDFVALQEVGKVLHPILAEGQVQGGVAQGIGYALYENVVYEKGRMMKRADDQLHYAHSPRPSRDSGAVCREALRGRSPGSQGSGRVADQRSWACHFERPAQCHRCWGQSDPRHSGDSDERDGGCWCLLRRCSLSRSTGKTTPWRPTRPVVCWTCCGTICATLAARRVVERASAEPARSTSTICW